VIPDIEFDEVDKVRIIAWTNERTHYYNDMVREAKGRDISKPFDLGDVVVVNEAYARDDEVIFSTGSEVKISNMLEGAHSEYPDLKVWHVTVTPGPSNLAFDVIHSDSKQALKNKLQTIRNEAIRTQNWSPYYRLKEWFIDLRQPYSLTAHKSQGSTFETVYVDFKDIYKNRKMAEADRCLYTAITRAAKKVIICY